MEFRRAFSSSYWTTLGVNYTAGLVTLHYIMTLGVNYTAGLVTLHYIMTLGVNYTAGLVTLHYIMARRHTISSIVLFIVLTRPLAFSACGCKQAVKGWVESHVWWEGPTDLSLELLGGPSLVVNGRLHFFQLLLLAP